MKRTNSAALWLDDRLDGGSVRIVQPGSLRRHGTPNSYKHLCVSCQQEYHTAEKAMDKNAAMLPTQPPRWHRQRTDTQASRPIRSIQQSLLSGEGAQLVIFAAISTEIRHDLEMLNRIVLLNNLICSTHPRIHANHKQC